jgi:hypothetical protein
MQMEENKLFVLRRKLLAIKITHWNDCIDRRFPSLINGLTAPMISGGTSCRVMTQ